MMAQALVYTRLSMALHDRTSPAVADILTRTLISRLLNTQPSPTTRGCWPTPLQAIVVTAMGCGPVTRLVRCAGFRGAFLTGVVVQSTCLLCASFLRPNAAG